MEDTGNKKFGGHAFRVVFRRSPNVLPLDSPTTLIIGQESVPGELLTAELE